MLAQQRRFALRCHYLGQQNYEESREWERVLGGAWRLLDHKLLKTKLVVESRKPGLNPPSWEDRWWRKARLDTFIRNKFVLQQMQKPNQSKKRLLNRQWAEKVKPNSDGMFPNKSTLISYSECLSGSAHHGLDTFYTSMWWSPGDTGRIKMLPGQHVYRKTAVRERWVNTCTNTF